MYEGMAARTSPGRSGASIPEYVFVRNGDHSASPLILSRHPAGLVALDSYRTVLDNAPRVDRKSPGLWRDKAGAD